MPSAIMGVALFFPSFTQMMDRLFHAVSFFLLAIDRYSNMNYTVKSIDFKMELVHKNCSWSDFI